MTPKKPRKTADSVQVATSSRMAEVCRNMLVYVSDAKHYPRTMIFDAEAISLREREYWQTQIELYEASS